MDVTISHHFYELPQLVFNVPFNLKVGNLLEISLGETLH